MGGLFAGGLLYEPKAFVFLGLHCPALLLESGCAKDWCSIQSLLRIKIVILLVFVIVIVITTIIVMKTIIVVIIVECLALSGRRTLNSRRSSTPCRRTSRARPGFTCVDPGFRGLGFRGLGFRV